MSAKSDISPREFFRQIMRFYVPLAIQAASQSLTYPLVGSIVSRGEFGSKGFGAFAQGQIMLFFFGAVGSGLITTGMMFARNRRGYETFRKLVLLSTAVIVAVQFAACFDPLRGFFFRYVLGLGGDYEQIARMAVLTGIPMQFAFLMRNISLVALYNVRKSAIANHATMARVAVTVLLAWLMPQWGLVGHLWGMAAMTLPVFGETLLTVWFARQPVANLADAVGGETASLRKQLRFTVPLSFGGMVLSSSVFVVAAALARTEPDPRLIAAIHYLVMGVVNPLGFAALKMQSTVIAFPPAEYGRRRIALFALGSGAVLTSLLAVFQFPAVARWYFCKVQQLDPGDLPLATGMLLLVSVYPLVQSLRGGIEGVAALRHRPTAVFAGQVAYLIAMIISLKFILATKILPGHLMGGTAIIAGIIMTMTTIALSLKFGNLEIWKFGNRKSPIV